jgi:hypothetical protein
MNRLVFVFLFFAVINSFANDDWGQTGHRTVAEIANQYLSEKAKAKINLILHGQSMAVASTFADEIKSDNLYNEFKVWHYANAKLEESYEASEKNEDGDIVVGIQYCIDVLNDPLTDEEDQTFYLKMLIHLIGDMHQPLHFGLKEDRGANDLKVEWFGKDSNFHRVWDSDMIKSYGMSYTEMAKNKSVLTPDEIKSYANGSLLDWVEDTKNLTKKVYKSAEEKENLGYKYMYEWYDILNLQLHIAGIRLAKVLNTIYS